MPGVDLRVRVDALGFAQLLVVKNAVAAANLALRRIKFGVTTKGLTLRRTPDGGSVAVDSAGNVVLVSSAPQMWDSTKLQTRMGLEIGDGELAVVPDQKMLTDPAVRYPLYIDPSYSTTQSLWTMINADAPSTSYWSDDFYRQDVRVGVVYGSGQGPWRTFFHFNIAPLARATVSRAWFAITLTHSASCAGEGHPVGLWHTKTLNPATAVTWNNSSGTTSWLGAGLDWQDGKANMDICGQGDKLMEFGLANGSVKAVVQEAVNGAMGPQEAIGLGLKVSDRNQSDTLYWKRFSHSSARLIVEYNTPPHAPIAVSTVPPTPCGTAAAPTPLRTATPTFSGVGYDPNSNNVSHDLELLAGETVRSTLSTGTAGSGTAVSWPAVPPGVLPTGAPSTVYSYRARTTDATLTGPYSARCYFTLDTLRPATPTVTSADFPGPAPVRSVGEAGRVTFARAAGDTDVAGFRYGFSQSSTTMWVAAGADGTATVPITLWPSSPGDTSNVSRPLYVRAVDRAGNASMLSPEWTLTARGRAVTAAPVRGDTNGDRRADLTAVVDQGFDRTTVWNLLSSPGGFHSATSAGTPRRPAACRRTGSGLPPATSAATGAPTSRCSARTPINRSGCSCCTPMAAVSPQ